nr:RNA-directed DNA polymerase, eukaryota, reverse transcriptase zinc-binding domain protein [Tanacetum cinerariifolium]
MDVEIFCQPRFAVDESSQSHSWGRRQFFNGHDPKSKKALWVKWSTVTSAKYQGGLGVASLYALNRALMLKWMWRFFANQDSLWTRVVKAIHGEDVLFGVLKIMEAIRSRFFNGIGQEDYKITWIAWNKALASKKRGGLGVSSFFASTELSF